MRVRLGRDARDRLADDVEARDRGVEQCPERRVDVRAGHFDQVVGDAAAEPTDAREAPVVDLVGGRA